VVIDTSALAVMLFAEPDAARFVSAIHQDRHRLLSAPTLVEASFVAIGRYGPIGGAQLDALLQRAKVHIVAFTAEHAEIARDAFERYGKGRHSAGLNLGDCFSYALSRASGEPLLCKGDDFSKTDAVLVALPQA
jgi:ribonuclease VapC